MNQFIKFLNFLLQKLDIYQFINFEIDKILNKTIKIENYYNY